MNPDDIDDGLDALERFLKSGLRVLPDAGGQSYYITKADGTVYTTSPDECDCPSMRACYHMKVVKLLIGIGL